MSKRTPHPWKVDGPYGSPSGPWYSVSGADESPWRGPRGITSGISSEDAHLIAAAPEMLEALKEAEKTLRALYASPNALAHFGDSPFVGPGLRQIQAAIKKAEGV